jgi:hypothetical protein
MEFQKAMPRKSFLFLVFITFISILFLIFTSHLAALNNIIITKNLKKDVSMPINKSRCKYIENNYKLDPKHYREKYKDYIIQGKIVEGMWPTEALLAGGGGTYRVKADKNVWPENSDPIRVMQNQSIKQDESEIIIQFCNKSQFSSENDVIFEVIFKMGTVEYITVKK